MHSSSAPDYLIALARFASAFRFADLPPPAAERVRWVLADCLPVIAAGMQSTEMREFSGRHLQQAAPGTAWVIGTARCAHPLSAALLNGTAGTWLELDEGSTYAKGHPGIQVVPAALGLAQQHGLSGEALLAAVAVGYEVSSRINRAARIREIVHPHGTFGVIGAAVAAAHLLRFDEKTMLTLLNIAASMTMATSYRTLHDGATVRNIYTGHSGYMGQIAVELAQSGFSGERDGVATTFGEILSDGFDPHAAIAGLGHEWMVADGYFKLHPTARSIQTAIDAMEDLLTRLPAQGIDVERIRRVEVSTYRRAAQKTQKAVTTSFGAKFSIPFAMATLLFHRRSGLESFSERAVANPAIQRVAANVNVSENPAHTAAYPQQQRCDLKVLLDDGTTLTGACAMTKGEPGNPISEQELTHKFFELGSPIWSREVTQRLYDTFMQIETVTDMRLLAGRFSL